MSLPAAPYQSPEAPLLAAVHNAGHALGCIATGRTYPFIVTAQVCRGNPLGLNPDPDRFSRAVICWAGPAAEAVAATRSGTTEQDAARWIWALYQAAYAGRAATGGCPQAAATDPAVIAVALAVAGANWTGIERIASALTGTARPRRPAQLGAEQVMALIGGRGGSDIGVAFGTWQRAIAEVQDRYSQGARLRWP